MEVLVYYKKELHSRNLWLFNPQIFDNLALYTLANSVFTQTHMILSYSNVQTTQTRVHKPLWALIHVLLSFQIRLLKCKLCHSLNSSYYDFFVVVNAHQHALWVQLPVANFLYRELFALSWGQLSVLLAPKAPSLCKSSTSSLSNSVNLRIWVQSIRSFAFPNFS